MGDPLVLQQALFYALEMQWEVLPIHAPIQKDGIISGCTCHLGSRCPRIGKHPITKHGCLDSSKKEAVIRAWWQEYPWANVAIATGGKSRLLVLDVDEEGMETLFRKSINIPDTVTCLTGKGSHHYFYIESGTWSNRENLLGTPGEKTGLDIRGENGYVLAPPSLHYSGKRYEWVCDLGPGDIKLSPVPPFILNSYMESSSTKRSEDDGKSIIPPGMINTTLTSIAGKCRRLGCNAEEIFTVIKSNYERRAKAGDLEYSAKTGQKPFTDNDLWKIARSIAKKPAENPLGIEESKKADPDIGVEVEKPATGLQQGLAAPIIDPPSVLSREDHLELIRQYLNLFITRVIKRGVENPQFEIIVRVPPPPDPESREYTVVLGSGLETLDPRRVRARIWETLLIQIPNRKQDAIWERITASMAALAELVKTTDTGQLLEEYIHSMMTISDYGAVRGCDLSNLDARKQAIPLLQAGGWVQDKEGHVYFTVLGLRLAAKRNHQVLYNPKDLACKLSQCGYTQARLRYHPNEYTLLQVRCWKTPDGLFLPPSMCPAENDDLDQKSSYKENL